MSSQPKKPNAPKRARPPQEIKQRREPTLVHADIVRMAKVEAENRAHERHDVIATAAYFRAQLRGFEPGHELEDWLVAEAEVVHTRQLGLMERGADTP